MSLSIKQLIEESMKSIKSLANLQKLELKSTKDLPYYNIACAQLIKVKMMIRGDEDCSDILPIVNSFLNTGAELKNELPKMIAKENLHEARCLYENIINMMGNIKEHL